MERTDRIEEEIKKIVGTLIDNGIKDPRVNGLISVTKVDVSKDMKYCKIYVTTLGDEAAQAEVKEALKSAAGFIRRELAHRLNLRVTPELTFLMDDSIEYSIHMAEMIKSIDLGPETEEEDEA